MLENTINNAPSESKNEQMESDWIKRTLIIILWICASVDKVNHVNSDEII